MASFRCYVDSYIIATMIITNFHLYLIQLWWQFFKVFVYGDVVYTQTWEILTLKNCIEPLKLLKYLLHFCYLAKKLIINTFKFVNSRLSNNFPLHTVIEKNSGLESGMWRHTRCGVTCKKSSGQNNDPGVSQAPCKQTQHCWMLHVASVCTPCCMLLDVVAVKLFSQQLPTFLLFRDRRSLAQQCWIRLHSSSIIIGATHAQYAWFPKTYGLYPSYDALQVPTLLGVVASVCTQPHTFSRRFFKTKPPKIHLWYCRS